jgi:signal peptidase I
MARVRTLAAELGYATALFVLAAVCISMFWALAPLAFGLRSSVVMSGSMAPGIRPGDVIVSFPTPVDDLRPGMVLSFTDPSRPDRTLIHRFVAVNPDGSVRTKGDANAEPDDAPVTAELINGQSRIRIPWIGLPAYWLRSGAYGSLGAAVLVIAAAAVLVSGRRRTPEEEFALLIGRHRAGPGARRLVPDLGARGANLLGIVVESLRPGKP